MAIPTHAEWKRTRNAAGGGAGEVKGVKLGEALDTYHKAVAKGGVIGMVAPLGALEKTLKTYQAGVKKKPKLAGAVQQIIAEVDKVQKDIQRVAKIPRTIEEGCTEVAKLVGKDWVKERTKVAALVRSIRAGADQLVDVDPSHRWAEIHRMTVIAHKEVEAVDKAVGAKSDKLAAIVDNATRNITDALKVIRKQNAS